MQRDGSSSTYTEKKIIKININQKFDVRFHEELRVNTGFYLPLFDV